MRATTFWWVAICILAFLPNTEGQSTPPAPSTTSPQGVPTANKSPATQPESLPWLPGTTAQVQTTSNPQTYTSTPAAGQPIPNAKPLISNPPPAIPNAAKSVGTPSPAVQQTTGLPSNPSNIPSTMAPSNAGGNIATTSLVSPNNPGSQQQAVPQPSPQQTQQGTQTQATQAQGATGNTSTPITKVTNGLQHLPNTAGQVWRTYDISPYTSAITNNPRPQQALIDWILKETGKEIWFTEPMGILNASKTELHVYHTPAIQERIRPLVDRFVKSKGQQIVMGLKMMTIGSPNWRASAISLMQPIDVQAQGLEAWLVTKENAALLFGQLRARGDYQERNSGDLPVVNGQQYTLKRTQPIELARSIGIVNDGVARYQPLMDRIENGFTLDFSSLNSLDGQTIEAIIGCEINQVEDVQLVTVNLPTAGGQTQPYQLQIPQLVSWEIEERFRWPSNMVLVISCGVVATPGPQKEALFGLPSLLAGTQGRADALMFVEYKGPARTIPGVNPNPAMARPTAGVAGQNGMIQPPPRR